MSYLHTVSVTYSPATHDPDRLHTPSPTTHCPSSTPSELPPTGTRLPTFLGTYEDFPGSLSSYHPAPSDLLCPVNPSTKVGSTIITPSSHPLRTLTLKSTHHRRSHPHVPLGPQKSHERPNPSTTGNNANPKVLLFVQTPPTNGHTCGHFTYVCLRPHPKSGRSTSKGAGHYYTFWTSDGPTYKKRDGEILVFDTSVSLCPETRTTPVVPGNVF